MTAHPAGRRTRALSTTVAVGLIVLSLAASGCGQDAHGDQTSRVTVLAAASLSEAFTTLGEKYEASHPGTTVTFSFANSAALATQINQGAPADLFAAAAPTAMATVTDADNIDGAPTTFARNRLVIAVPPGNPKHLDSLAALTAPGVTVALCAERAPCGTAARTALDTAGVTLTPVTLEQDVKGALSKVILGEVDAALVYRTDTRAAAGKVDGIEFPESTSAVNDYPIAVLRHARDKKTARAFLSYVLSDTGRTVLSEAGFQLP